MTDVLLHDSGRSGATGWAVDVIRSRSAVGMIINPFSTPRLGIPRVNRNPAIEGADSVRNSITAAGGAVFFDPTTHGVLAAGADNFRLYDTWDLWSSGSRGVVSPVALADHVHRCITRAHELRLVPIAPTLPLAVSTSPDARQALEMARLAVQVEPSVYLAVVGTSNFWSDGPGLDAFVGELAQLRPAGFVVTVRREALRYPPAATAAEVEGVCRSVHSLSLRGQPVIAAHSDLSGLPATAAGATHVGSGWDLRHRVMADDLFRQSSGVRRASQRVTHRGLIASLKRPEAEQVLQADPALSTRLVPGDLPGDHNAHWRHHLVVLTQLVRRVSRTPDRADRVQALRTLYRAAGRDFTRVVGAAGRLEAAGPAWIDPLADGLDRYAGGEGY